MEDASANGTLDDFIAELVEEHGELLEWLAEND